MKRDESPSGFNWDKTIRIKDFVMWWEGRLKEMDGQTQRAREELSRLMESIKAARGELESVRNEIKDVKAALAGEPSEKLKKVMEDASDSYYKLVLDAVRDASKRLDDKNEESLKTILDTREEIDEEVNITNAVLVTSVNILLDIVMHLVAREHPGFLPSKEKVMVAFREKIKLLSSDSVMADEVSDEIADTASKIVLSWYYASVENTDMGTGLWDVMSKHFLDKADKVEKTRNGTVEEGEATKKG
jgi:hypothetical protein